MIYSVYALREVGTTDIRYIGQTRYDGARRLRFLSYLARKGNGEPNMREWLESIQYRAEAVAIATSITEVGARQLEKQAIGMFAAAGHKLLNRQHMLEQIEPYAPKQAA